MVRLFDYSIIPTFPAGILHSAFCFFCCLPCFEVVGISRALSFPQLSSVMSRPPFGADIPEAIRVPYFVLCHVLMILYP